ncbi:MAG: class I SAM-dependent methyltransferase family protein [Acidilobaceae archaeon]|nr:class I SAM-dependent methyltransferase family protein [Acidilobaceae archaeon]MCX8165218.1 class I SAM-dependent methyltransferase family protein [Acidilobaceae archaeon]MDW7974266.1 class I SAM-dependent methyltransferase family protein [Sulfolobales archaeon]
MTHISLRELLRELLGPGAWSRVEIVGDIAIIKKPFGAPAGEGYRRAAEEILRRVPHVKSVWLAVTPVEGAHKVRQYEHLAGERRSETVYREHGCSFRLDITKAFISPRLSYEHLRLAKLVREGEVVVNMFAGVGISSIVIAKKAKPRLVHSIDINEEAYRYMVENIRLNRVEGRVIPHLGDAAAVVRERLVGVAERVLMPLPALALEYLPYALLALKGRGFLHVFLHVRSREEAERLVRERLEREGRSGRILGSREVRSVGPRLEQVVVDVEVE